jgi:hypothetical protein
MPSERFAEFPEGLDLVRIVCADTLAAHGYDGPSR